jgi:hypothetical protein
LTGADGEGLAVPLLSDTVLGHDVVGAFSAGT